MERHDALPPSWANLEATALLRDLAAGRIPRLLLVHGPEPLLVDALIGRRAAAVFRGEAAAALNREVIQADAVTPETLVTAGLALPLFGGRRLLLIRGLADAPVKTVERLKTVIDTARAQPGGWPGVGITVALVASGAGRRTPALRLVGEAEQVEVRPPVGRAVVGWLRERARAANLDLTPEAAQAWITLVGEDLSRLAGELEKAALFVEPDGRVTEAVVRALAGESRVRQYWELTQALEGGDRSAALRVLENLLQAGEEPLVLLTQIMGFARDVWRVRAGLAQRMTASQIGARLPRRRPEWAVERLMARAAGWPAESLTRAVRCGFQVELRLKSSGGSPRALLTALVADLAGT